MGTQKTTNSRDAPEQVQQLPLENIHPFKDHPFKIVDDDLMQQTVDSISQVGIVNPAIVRPDPTGGYEMVSGHRRLYAAELAGFQTMPAIVRNLTDDEAVILMVDSNLQRETLLPSERAFAYRMKLDAMKRQAGRPSKENCSQLGNNSGKRSSEIFAEQIGQSKNQIFRYIHLTELLPKLLDMVDDKKIALNPAYELSYLSSEEQEQLLDAMDYSQNTPSLSQAQALKKLSKEGKCTQEAMYSIMSEEKKPPERSVTLSEDTIRKYFPRNYSSEQITETIIKLLQAWQKKRQRQSER